MLKDREGYDARNAARKEQRTRDATYLQKHIDAKRAAY